MNKHEIYIFYEKTQLPCNPFNMHYRRRGPNLKERQQPGTCYEFPNFTNTHTTTTITTSTLIDYTTVTATDKITDPSIATVTTTTAVVTSTNYDDVTSTVTSTPVTTSTVFTRAQRTTITKVQTVIIEIHVLQKNSAFHPWAMAAW
jgi:hypothetical protein